MRYCNQCGDLLELGANWTKARKDHHTYTCNACLNIRSVTWRENNPERRKVTHQKMGLKKYGLTIKEYESLCEESGNTCYICGTHRDTQKRNLHVDHSHVTGKVRGVLCSNCNTALGKFQDNTDILNRAIKYLEENNES